MTISSSDLKSALLLDLSTVTLHNETQRFAVNLLLENFTKKCHDLRTEACAEVAVSKFFEREAVNRSYNETGYDESQFGDAKYFLWKQFDGSRFVSYEELASHLPQSGPGANVGPPSTSAWIKLFNSKLTTSSTEAYNFYLDLLSSCHLLAASESLRCQQYGGVEIKDSRLTTVPKTNETDRTICIEPIVNTALQQCVRHCLERRLRGFGINLSNQQTVNRQLARLGSLGQGFATIDLRSASDSITRGLTQMLFPRYLHELFVAVSSKSFTYRGKTSHFEMLCSMGNAITFPLQTVIFSSIVKQAYSNLGLTFVAGRTFSCFGDDIIVRSDAYHEVTRLLQIAGFVVNDTKSYHEGEFRESCGADWFSGNNVRSVYARDLKDKHSLTALYNQVRTWSARHGIWLENVLRLVRPYVFSNRVPMHAPIDSGIREVLPLGRYNRATWSFDYVYFQKAQKKRKVRGTDHRSMAGHLAGYCQWSLLPKRTFRQDGAANWYFFQLGITVS